MKLADAPKEYRTKEFQHNNVQLERAINKLAEPAAVCYSTDNYVATRTLDVTALSAESQDLGAVLATLIDDLKLKGVLA